MSLEENVVLEALVACEPEPLVSLEDAALPARWPSLPSSPSSPSSSYSIFILYFNMILCIRSPLKTVSILSDVYDRELVATIGWAKQVHSDQSMVMMISLKGDCDDHYDHCTVFQVPGFTDLTLNDQMKLLQSSWTEVAQLFTNLSVIPTRSNSF